MLSSATPAIPARGSSLASLNRQTRRSASGARRGASVTVRAEGKKEAEGLFAKLKAIVPSTEVGENDGRGGRELSTGSIVELIGMGAGFPMPSDVKVDTENIRVIMGKYRDEGWVDDKPAGPGFWASLFGKKEEVKEEKEEDK